MAEQFDIIIAGAGHNSLFAAAYLAKAGRRCLVLDGRPVIGGNCVTDEPTLPGFKHDSCASAHVVIQDSPALANDELQLSRTPDISQSEPAVAVQYNSRYLLVDGDQRSIIFRRQRDPKLRFAVWVPVS